MRWGGEELVIFLLRTEKDKAMQVAEKIQTLIDDATSNELKDITISVMVLGVSEYLCTDRSIDNAINRADEAMYCAKENGRNQVCYESTTS